MLACSDGPVPAGAIEGTGGDMPRPACVCRISIRRALPASPLRMKCILQATSDGKGSSAGRAILHAQACAQAAPQTAWHPIRATNWAQSPHDLSVQTNSSATRPHWWTRRPCRGECVDHTPSAEMEFSALRDRLLAEPESRKNCLFYGRNPRRVDTMRKPIRWKERQACFPYTHHLPLETRGRRTIRQIGTDLSTQCPLLEQD